jgi:hypothetical protein
MSTVEVRESSEMITLLNWKIVLLVPVVLGGIGYLPDMPQSFARNNCSDDTGHSFLDSLQDTACDIFTDGKGFGQSVDDNWQSALQTCHGNQHCASRLINQHDCALQRQIDSMDPNYNYYYSSPC